MCRLAKKCCFCIPLRKGLLAWGYIYLIIDLLLCVYSATIIISLRLSSITAVLVSVSLIIILLDTIFTLTLILGLHKNKGTLVKVYFYFLILDILLLTAYVIYGCATWINDYVTKSAQNVYVVGLVIEVVPTIIDTLIKCYILWMVKSQIAKMNNPKIRGQRTTKFVNNIVEPHCTVTLDNEEIIYGNE